MAKGKKPEEFITVELKGIARDAHKKFPITFDYGASGNAYLIGCKVHASKDVNGKTFENRIDIRAFGEVAEELAGLADGSAVHIKGEYGLNKVNDAYYPIVTVTEVISVD